MLYTTHHIDDAAPLVYVPAPDVIATAIRRRFEYGAVVMHPSKAMTFIHEPNNFWDGPRHIRFEVETGHFVFSGWEGEEHFPLIGPLR